MTIKHYYQDQYSTSLTTTILTQNTDENGQYVTLKETIFYPTGGGQPHDTGTISSIPVTQVEEVDGEIRHYLQEAITTSNTEVVTTINWQRRHDHMQQHAGQHILTAAFAESLDYETISFHLGTDICTIDLATSKLLEEEAAKAEQLANQIIQEARPIETKWITADELHQYPMRKQPTVSENIRLVIIPDFDYNGCGGTHPSSTSEVGSLKILHWEKHKDGTRLSFVAGDRVLTQLEKKHKTLQQLTSLLQSPEESLVLAGEKILHKQKEQDQEITQLKEQLSQYEAKELAAVCRENGQPLIATFENRSIKELQTLAQKIITTETKAIVALLVQNEDKLQFVFAKGEDIELDLRPVAKQLMEKINGKGGGKPNLVQGGGEAILPIQEVKMFVAELVK
ncbi:alanyl-tRNA editing protein [Mangrovibacillus cuniculi]|uniref:Alanyl-tRNA editing protein n=1 Tax=Mangrovibacillus cuniculi TaxID=2593652 RepID=A0A7S8CE08_9BACI|nr:DHHA1 domain-containing protein [Mangrovibacillus cuniculi]QPC48264.1 alanyl-tRNA editing protein [Mangrovibacillus cuniculi]